MARINYHSELPDWFNLKNYDNTRLLTPVQWFFELKHRSILYSSLKSFGKNDIEKIETYTQIKKSGLLANSQMVFSLDDELSEGAYLATDSGGLVPWKTKQPTRVFVDPIRVSDISDLYLDHAKPYIDDERHSTIRKDTISELPSFKLIDELIKYGSGVQPSAHLKIDLSAPDKRLVAEFEKLLPLLRQKLATDTAGKERMPVDLINDLNHLCTYQSLPYLDLNLWAQLGGNRIANNVLIVALFPQGGRGDDVLRKTVIPKAEQAISRPYLDSLLSMIS